VPVSLSGVESPQEALRRGRKSWHFLGTVGVDPVGGTLQIPFFDIPVGCKAIAIGPSSSLSEIAVVWTPPGASQSILLTVDAHNPLIMDLPVNPNQVVIDQYANGFPTTSSMKIVPYYVSNALPIPKSGGEQLELMMYFDLTNVVLPRGRPDVSAQFWATNQVKLAENLVFEVPGYGRKQIAWELDVIDAVKTVTAWRFVGVTHYLAGASVISEVEHQISPAPGGAANTVAALGSAAYVLGGTRYHAYRLYATGSADFTQSLYSYTLSD
jgi:hypothetical protein